MYKTDRDRTFVNARRNRLHVSEADVANCVALSYCSFAYSALASFRMGMSGSASFQSVRKSL
jgi:hypothetical protein